MIGAGMHQDIVEIEQLLNCYCHAVDRGLVDEIVDAFHPDGVLLLKWKEHTLVGHRAIREWFDDYVKMVAESKQYSRHKITCPWIRIEGAKATAISYLDGECADKATGRVKISAGRYEDELVKEDGRWRFKQRAIFIDGSVSMGC